MPSETVVVKSFELAALRIAAPDSERRGVVILFVFSSMMAFSSVRHLRDRRAGQLHPPSRPLRTTRLKVPKGGSLSG